MSTILITGATGAIGTSVCHYLAGKGHALILASRSVDKLANLSCALKDKHDASIIYHALDFSSLETIGAFASSLKDQTIDGLVLMPPQPPETNNCLPEPEVWRQLFNNSFIGPVELIRKLMPNLQTSKSSVVLISGISSVQPLSKYSTSNVLRTTWLGQMKTLADNYGSEGIRFNTLSLGGVITEPFKKKIEQEAAMANTHVAEVLKQRVANIPLRRYALPDEIANMLDMLLTSLGSVHLTGQNIKFDGGFTRPY